MIYLDSAATTLQKPPRVATAMSHALGQMSSPGRGGHYAAMRAADTVFACRSDAAELFQVPEPEQVIFTFNATHALNIAIRSLVHPGSTVLISGYEHNAVTRTLASIPDVQVRVAAGPLFRPETFLDKWEAQLDGVNVAICNHVSNVFGYILPVERAAALCHRRGIPFVLDASQSAGCLPISLSKLGAAFIAMPGHKGLYGPQGTGLLLCAAETRPLLTGGTGSASAQAEMPDFLPDRLEAGTPNIPGIAGLLEGIRFVRRQGIDQILTHERRLAHQAARGLAELPGVEVFSSSADLLQQAGVVSFRVRGMDVEEVGALLGQAGIAVRAGLHCAPLAHKSAGTLETGTVRLSFSAFNHSREIKQLIFAVKRLSALNLKRKIKLN